MKLMEKFGLDRHEIQERRNFVRLSEEDLRIVRELRPVVERHLDPVVDAFYQHLQRFPGTSKFLTDEHTISRLKRLQREYFLEMFSSTYDEAYVERRLQIGVTHEKIGLVPKWYLGSFANIQTMLFPLLAEEHSADPQKLLQAVNAVIKVMNLDQQLAIDTYIGTTVGQLQGMVREIREAVNVVASSSTQILATIETQQRVANEQSASVNETTTTMDQLDASFRQSTEQAEAAAVGSREALTAAERGTKVVEKTLEGMSSLKEKVGAIAEQILRLSEQTNQIGSITNLVTDIANQTNLLALNAAVEAARAGEHGRGFAVVAVEIRKLADQSKKSAERINALVADIQKATNSTVMVTEEGTKTVEEGTRLAQQTADAFAGVAASIGAAYESVQQISLNAQQQAQAVKPVVEAMAALNAGAKETLNGMTETKAGVQKLNEVSQRLKQIAEGNGSLREVS